MRYCSPVKLVFHPGAPLGVVSGSALTLLDLEEELVGPVPLPVEVAQLVQGVDFLGGSSPANWPRGNRRTRMEWTVWRPSDSAAESVEDGLTDALTLPDADGWVAVTLASPVVGTWAIADVAVQSIRAAPDEAVGRAITYTLAAGELLRTADIPVAALPGHAILAEDGDYLLSEDGRFFVLESAT